MKGQARPGVQKPQEFTYHVEGIAGGAPPAPGIEGIGGSGTHDGAGMTRNELAPKQANAACMNFCRDKDYGRILSGFERGCDAFNFVSGIYDGSSEDVNRVRGHAFVNQNKLVVIVLAGE